MEIPRIFPDINPPKKLTAFRAGEVSRDERLALKCLQGLVNRENPSIYEITAPCDEHWLRYYDEKFGIGFDVIDEPMGLFEDNISSVEGLVILDPDLPDSQNLGITMSGLQGLLPARGELADRLGELGLDVREDLTNRFTDRVSAYSWAKEELLPGCNGRILGSLCVGKRKHWAQNRIGVVDYLVLNRSFVFHLSAARRDREENVLFDDILSASGGQGVVMGWHCARDQEKEYVSRSAKKGFFVLCSASTPNLSIHGGIPPARESYSQRKPAPLGKVENKVYLSLYLTDGDANWAMNSLHTDNWLSENRGKIPFNWGLLPLMWEMSPGMLEYYYETATDNDYFACPSSGAAYTYSHLHGDWYLRYSKHYMDLTGQVVANMVNWNTNLWWREVEDPRAIYREKMMLRPAGLVTGLGGSVFATSYPTGTPKVHAAMVLDVKEDCADKINSLIGRIKERPLFLFAFVQINRGVFDHLIENLASLPGEVELLHMDTFMMTLRRALREGLVGEDLYPSREDAADMSLVETGTAEGEASCRLIEKLAGVSGLSEEDMLREINLGNWINLAAKSPCAVEADWERWRKSNEGYLPYDTANLADGLGYNLFYSAWALVRSRLNAAGVYANHMDRCLDDYLELFPDPRNGVLEDIWEMWRRWYEEPPSLDGVVKLTGRLHELSSGD